MLMTLQLRDVDDHSFVIHSQQFPILIGRGEDADVHIPCRWASRKHCEISASNGVLILRDLRSRYGTTVNGKPVRETELAPGDEVTVGLKRFVVEVEQTTPIDAESECHQIAN